MLNIKKRSQLISELARRAYDANLGLFIGTGFSMAMNNKTCNFEKLVRFIYDADGTQNFEEDRKNKPEYFFGKSLPQIVECIENEKGRKYVLAVVVKRCSINVNNECDEKYVGTKRIVKREDVSIDQVREALSIIKPQWIITTNYDLIIEQLIEKSETIGPNNPFSIREGLVQIFHIHGHVREPENIVISENDYADFLSSNIYRQERLSSALAESSVLFMGYSLSDINIRIAMKQAKKYSLNSCKRNQEKLIVLLDFDSNARDLENETVNYDEQVGLFSVKVKNLRNFLKEISAEVKNIKYELSKKKRILKVNIDEIENDKSKRIQILSQLNETSNEISNEIGNIFLEIIDRLWNNVDSERSFSSKCDIAVRKIVGIAIDLLHSEYILSFCPQLFYKLMCILEQISRNYRNYVVDIPKSELSDKVILEIYNIIESNDYLNLRKVFFGNKRSHVGG